MSWNLGFCDYKDMVTDEKETDRGQRQSLESIKSKWRERSRQEGRNWKGNLGPRARCVSLRPGPRPPGPSFPNQDSPVTQSSWGTVPSQPGCCQNDSMGCNGLQRAAVRPAASAHRWSSGLVMFSEKQEEKNQPTSSKTSGSSLDVSCLKKPLLQVKTRGGDRPPSRCI